MVSKIGYKDPKSFAPNMFSSKFLENVLHLCCTQSFIHIFFNKEDKVTALVVSRYWDTRLATHKCNDHTSIHLRRWSKAFEFNRKLITINRCAVQFIIQSFSYYFIILNKIILIGNFLFSFLFDLCSSRLVHSQFCKVYNKPWPCIKVVQSET